MNLYQVKNGEVFAVSLVEDPAIEESFIALSKQIQVKLNDEKRLIIGPALIPDKPIYRYMNGKEFYISFDSQTIQEMASSYLRNGQITLEHSEDTDGAYIVESWIKTNELDKSNEYGFNEPIGTWFLTIKIIDDQIWQGIKDGTYKGFSIEAMINMSKETNFIDELKKMIDEFLNPKDEEVQMEETPIVEEDELSKLKEENESIKAENEDLKSKIEEQSKEIETKDNEINDLKKQIDDLTNKNVELSKQPSVKPTNCKDYAAAVKLMIK